jgi:hypothetical protein
MQTILAQSQASLRSFASLHTHQQLKGSSLLANRGLGRRGGTKGRREGEAQVQAFVQEPSLEVSIAARQVGGQGEAGQAGCPSSV